MRKMKSSDLLLSLSSEHLKIWKVGDTVCVNYHYSWLKDGSALLGVFGRGQDFESACDDYLRQIRGKYIVFDQPGCKRKELYILG